MGMTSHPSGVVPIGAVDHRDAIRGRDPLQQIGGLLLDFVTKVISSPFALFLVIDDQAHYKLAEVKADPILTPDPRLLAQEYLQSVAVEDPVFEMAVASRHARIAGTEHLRNADSYSGSALETEFLAGNDLGPVLALILGDRVAVPHCMILLFRSSEEPEFGEREKAFLRNAAPVFTQSYHCAAGVTGGSGPPVNDNADDLTPREREIAVLAAEGMRNHEIGEALHIAPGTVKCHIRNIYAKLGVDSRIHLARALGLTV